jgi:hypothetical protein
MLLTGLAWMALLASAPIAAADSPSYAEARAFAERDEKDLTATEYQTIVQAHSGMIGEALRKCVDPADPPAAIRVAVVMELDAHGGVVGTWHRDDDELTSCFERQWAGVLHAAPPRVPFYTFIELDLNVRRKD